MIIIIQKWLLKNDIILNFIILNFIFKHDEMNRTKANLLFHTKHGYEDMIRRYENEMQFNHRPYSSRQEAHILNEITSLKQGMVLFDNFEEQKKGYDLFKETLAAKKNEQEVGYTNSCWLFKFIAIMIN